MPSAPSLTLVSKCTVFPDQKSTMEDLKLSVSDLPMLSCHYIQKGGLFTRPHIPIDSLVSLLKNSLSQTLSYFPPLAGRLKTDSNGYVYITCNDAGVDFLHACATHLSICDILSPVYVPECVKSFFAFDRTVSYDGHYKPILAVQVTELADGVFIGCALNHSVTDGTSIWNFFNTFAELQEESRKSRRCCSPIFQETRADIPGAHNDEMVRRFVKNWEEDPKCFPLGNFDGASMTMGSSPRFPMYDNDFGWGRPWPLGVVGPTNLTVRSLPFQGGKAAEASILEVVLAPETMAGIESDYEFMQYVSN
ncbi:hypothetical protein GH714_012582 [Hevea brasiliensis]|uniref:BAHD family acyltransferase n=1 Tax=Hevea brasiliensis TaxID=3981 RepID=A0A6A6N373_HEVBR|nr:hypothetical protein GH714_012582 [Hevea brasiliensis]